MGGEVVAPGAEVRDFAEFINGPVPVVGGRNKGLQIDKLICSAAFAIGTADVFGLHQRGAVRVQASPAGVGGGAAVHCLGERAYWLEAAGC